MQGNLPMLTQRANQECVLDARDDGPAHYGIARSQVSGTDPSIQEWNERTLGDRGCLSSGERAGAANHFFSIDL
jgi:hypothetical protein